MTDKLESARARIVAARKELDAAEAALRQEEQELRLWSGDGMPNWFVDEYGAINWQWEQNAINIQRPTRRVFGNVIRTEPEAKEHAKRLRLFNVLSRLATETGNEGGLRIVTKPQWTAYGDSNNNVGTTVWTSSVGPITAIWFNSEADCERAITYCKREGLL